MYTRLAASHRLALTGLGLSAILLLGACAGMSRQDQNTAVGAGVGAVGGAVLTGGSAVGTVGGAAIGGLIGNQIDNKK
jgi:osmotically inducible lipoprotein OsmB